jgi:hypothetical protein
VHVAFFYSDYTPTKTKPIQTKTKNHSVGVIRQITTAFGPRGLTTADGRAAYAEPSRLGRVAGARA